MKVREQDNLADAMRCLDFGAPDLAITHDEEERRKIAQTLWNFTANVIADSLRGYGRDQKSIDHVRSMLIDRQPESDQ